MTGEIVYRPPEHLRHNCQPPMRCRVYAAPVAPDWPPKFKAWRECTGWHDGYGCINGEAAEPIGAVWRCDCGRNWIVYMPQNHPASSLQVEYRPTWRPASWLERFRARRAARAGG